MSVQSDLQKLADPQRAEFFKRFFKTGKGQYGQGDEFMGGINVPTEHIIARKYKNLTLKEIELLLTNKYHECRTVALMIMKLQWNKANKEDRKKLFDCYLANRKHINNWDLVDISAPTIVGRWLLDKPEERKFLYTFAKSDNLWERRIAVLTTFAFLRSGDYKDTLAISEILIHDTHDLIHKAVGWMLRELGKRDQKAEEEFLLKHYKTMPRTMLRYAIEKFPEMKRKFYMSK
jgi:3-methyladenine DNA glycosylase AlkD